MTPLPAPSPVPPVIYVDRTGRHGTPFASQATALHVWRSKDVSLPPPFDPSLITLSALCASGRASVEGVR